jgi:hypothetical protein
MKEDVHSIAAAYVREFTKKHGTTVPRVQHGNTRFHASSVYEDIDIHRFVAKVKDECAMRYEIGDVNDLPKGLVLKMGHKYYYGMKGNEVKWTYDIYLAHAFAPENVEPWVKQLESLGFKTTIFPAPPKRD